jgi:hypothetical protein
MSNHFYFVFSSEPRAGALTQSTLAILKYYGKVQKSKERWLKDKKQYTATWTQPKTETKQISKPFNYKIISDFIRNNGIFNPAHFNLPDMNCFWMDFALDMKINFHSFDHTAPEGLMMIGRVQQQQFGVNYPIEPKLDREGHLYTQMQTQLFNRIIKLRTTLVETSNLALTDDWVFDFRSLINDTISLVDITLIQFYIKAEYDPLPGWKFNKELVGERHGRRIVDKFKWIYEITGNHFPMNATKEMKSFETLRKLRNHLMHFDPPSLVILIEEVALWLNQVIDIGFFLIKMREAIGIDLSVQLINYILQKEVIFKPESSFSKRLPINSRNAGYLSSCWPERDE